VVAQLLKEGKVVRGYIGVEAQDITPATAEAMHLQENDGALLAGVQPDGPAAYAGLQPGDVVESVNSSKIRNPRALALAIAGIPPGDHAHLTVLHDGQTKDITVKVGTLPNEQTASNDNDGNGERQAQIGLALAPLSPDLRDQLNVPDGTKGVVVQNVQAGSPAEEAGLQPGDVIVGVGTHGVSSPAEATRALHTALNGNSHALALRIIRNGQPIFVGVAVGHSNDQG
jgi:serine protease Do